ncbi:MAG: hypothetical protein SPH93_15865 [Clostridium sp.]|uniref:hypothetical protein n=1 Tax=Clostridium sp. TaxID=1506 RepID=UPI002A818BD7|nr:hypothetical protein [Clostridium sp.]MDY4253012.1 hypothetical protein [Clostridium sp.]MDY6229108.1 hypothetical protein [Clostridium sp.]
MKKTFIALMILSLSFGVVGCKSDKEETTSNSNEVVTQEKSKKNDKRSDDEMYDLYTSKLEDIEKIFKENNIDFKDKKNTDKYDGKTGITYEDSDKDNVGEFSIADYNLYFDEEGSVRNISLQISVNVNDDEMKTKEFKFEDTEFYKLKNILIPEINNIDEINKKVNEGYKNGTSTGSIKFENENVQERILLGDNMLVYTVIIKP